MPTTSDPLGQSSARIGLAVVAGYGVSTRDAPNFGAYNESGNLIAARGDRQLGADSRSLDRSRRRRRPRARRALHRPRSSRRIRHPGRCLRVNWLSGLRPKRAAQGSLHRSRRRSCRPAHCRFRGSARRAWALCPSLLRSSQPLPMPALVPPAAAPLAPPQLDEPGLSERWNAFASPLAPALLEGAALRRRLPLPLSELVALGENSAPPLALPQPATTSTARRARRSRRSGARAEAEGGMRRAIFHAAATLQPPYRSASGGSRRETRILATRCKPALDQATLHSARSMRLPGYPECNFEWFACC